MQHLTLMPGTMPYRQPIQPLAPVHPAEGGYMDDGTAGTLEDEYDDDDDDDMEDMPASQGARTNSAGQPNGVVNYKSKPRRKSSQRPESSDQKRQAFSKRKRGLVLKSYQLYKLTDAKVFMFVVNDKGSSWAYASPGFGQCLSPGHLRLLREYAKLPSVPKTGTEIMGHPRKDEVDRTLDDRDIFINNHSLEAHSSGLGALDPVMLGLQMPGAVASGPPIVGVRGEGPVHSGVSNGDRFMPPPTSMPPPMQPPASGSMPPPAMPPPGLPPPGMPPPGLPQVSGEGCGPSGPPPPVGKRPPPSFGLLAVEEPGAEPPSLHDTIITPSGRRMAAAIGISLDLGGPNAGIGNEPPPAPRGSQGPRLHSSSGDDPSSGSGSRGRRNATDRSTSSSDTRSNPPGGPGSGPPQGSSGGTATNTGGNSNALPSLNLAHMPPPPAPHGSVLSGPGSSSGGPPPMHQGHGGFPVTHNTPVGLVVQGTDGILYRVIQELTAPPVVEQPLVVNYFGSSNGHAQGGPPPPGPLLQFNSGPPLPGWGPYAAQHQN